MTEHLIQDESNNADESVDDLKKRIKELEAKIFQMEEVSAALVQAQESHERSSQSMIELQTSLQGALKSNRKQLEEISKAHERFLPHRYPKAAGVEVAAHCHPCADVGGDFYDVFQLYDGRLAITMADVAGHGAVASISMATSRALLRTALLEAEPYHSPSDVLERLSFWLQNQFDTEQFVTMWLGIYDPETNKLSVCSAAHPKAVIWRKDQDLEYLQVNSGLPLGLSGIETGTYEELTIQLNIGDRIFLYTDGWNETPSKDGTFLEEKEFLEFCANTYGHSVREVSKIMFMQFERHAANSKIRDDISLLVFDRVE